jgi:hypothetical protein
MKHTVLLFILLAAVVSIKAGPARFQPNTIILRMSADSPELQQWLANERTGELPRLREILGPHTTQGYVSSATLRAVKKSRREKETDQPLSNTPLTIERIVVVKTERTIDPVMLSRKIASMSGIDYGDHRDSE